MAWADLEESRREVHSCTPTSVAWEKVGNERCVAGSASVAGKRAVDCICFKMKVAHAVNVALFLWKQH